MYAELLYIPAKLYRETLSEPKMHQNHFTTRRTYCKARYCYPNVVCLSDCLPV